MTTQPPPMPEPVSHVQRMGSYQGVPAHGALLSIKAEGRVPINTPLYTAGQIATRDTQWQSLLSEAVQQARAEALEEAAKASKALDAVRGLNAHELCMVVHHAKRDQHGIDEPCPVAARIHTGLAAIRALQGGGRG